MDFVQRIYDFNQDNGLLDRGYSDYLESSFQIEEALEGLKHLPALAELVGTTDAEPKTLARWITCRAYEGKDFIQYTGGEAHFAYPLESLSLSDVDRLDKACDAIVYAIGSIAKLGLDHHGITKALNIVNNANKAKLGMARDEHNKLLKPADFVGPEAELAKLLSETRR